MDYECKQCGGVVRRTVLKGALPRYECRKCGRIVYGFPEEDTTVIDMQPGGGADNGKIS